MMKYCILILIAIFGFSCSKTQEVSSLRIIGSNTDYNNITTLDDGNSALIKKSEINFLKNSDLASLTTKTLKLDSLEIEKVAGNSDTLFLLGKSDLNVFLSKTLKIKALKNFGFSYCDQIAKVDSFVVWSNGGTACQPSIASKINLLVFNSKSELVLKNQLNSGAVYTKLLVYNKKIIGLTNSGLIDIYEIKDFLSLNKLGQISNLKATDLKIFGSRFLIKTDTGVAQYKLQSDNTLSKVNQVNVGSL